MAFLLFDDSKKKRIRWLLLDRFTTDRAAGAINGTASEPGPGGNRTETDSGSAATITGGEYKVTAIAGARDPWLRYAGGVTRAAGRMFRFDARASGLAADNWLVGLANTLTTPGVAQTLGVVFGASTIKAGIVNTQIASYTPGTDTTVDVILHSTGHDIVIGGKLHYIYRAGNTATLYPHAAGLVADAAVDCYVDDKGYVQLPLTPTKFSTPTLSDTFPVPQIADNGDLGLHGTPVNVGLNGSSGQYNGTSSYTNIYSAGLDTLFSGVQGTVIARTRKYTGFIGSYPTVIHVGSDNNNRVFIAGQLATGLKMARIGGGVESSVIDAGLVPTVIFTAGMTWDKNAAAGSGELKAFINGSQSGVTQNGLGAYTGSLNSAKCLFGGADTIPSYSWDGSIADTILSDVVASPAQMATIHTDLAAGTLSKATLDSIFGAGHYVWYKHNEQYKSNGLAHVEAGGVNGANVIANSVTGKHYNASNKAYHTPTPGSNVVVNGTFGADTDWTKGTDWSIGSGVATKAAGTASDLTAAVAPLVANTFYLATYDITRSAGTVNLKFGTAIGPSRALTGSYSEVVRANGTALAVAADAAFAGTVDNLVVKPLTLSDLLVAYAPASAGNPYTSAKMTIDAGYSLGFMVNLDSYTNPQNGTLVYFSRASGKVYALNLVGGSWQADSLAGVNFTYSAAGYGEIRRIDNEEYVFYNNGTIGSFDVAAVPAANTLIARLHTNASSYFESLTSFPTDILNYAEYA